MQQQMPHETDEVDDRLLKALENGGRTPGWLIDNLDLPMSTSSAVGHRLKVMKAAGLVENIGHGIYELPGGYVPAGREQGPEVTHARGEGQEADPVSDSEHPLDGVKFPATVGHEEAAEAVFAAREYLRQYGKATKADFIRDVMPKYPMGYDIPEDPSDDKGSWWRRVVKPGLEAFDDVKKPPEGGSDWRHEEA